MSGLAFGLAVELAFGLAFRLMVGLTSGSMPTVSFTELVLATTGAGRVKFIRVLEDAHHRQVLCQAGAVYQFRHAELSKTTLPRPPQAHSTPGKYLNTDSTNPTQHASNRKQASNFAAGVRSPGGGPFVAIAPSTNDQGTGSPTPVPYMESTCGPSRLIMASRNRY